MALSRTQQSSIRYALGLDLYFTNDPEELIQNVAAFTEAITSPIDKENNFYMLRELLFKPTAYLIQLENETPITVGAVQRYMIEHITEFLTKMAQEAEIDFSTLKWDQKAALDNLIKENDNVNFISLKTTADAWRSPWELPRLEGKIYTENYHVDIHSEYFEEIDQEVTTKFIVVDVQVPCISDESKTIVLCEISNFFANDDEERVFIESKQALAQSEAQAYAADQAINYLVKKKYITRNEARSARRSEAAKMLITQEYYFDRIKKRDLRFSKILALSIEEAITLSDSIINDLIQNRLCPFDTAKSLTSSAKKVATDPAYYSLLKSGEVQIQEIEPVSVRRADFLTNPRVANLILTRKLTFQQALLLPIELKSVFSNNHLDWDKCRQIQASQWSLLLNANFSRFIVNNHRNLESICELTPIGVANINNYPHLLNWVESGFISFSDLNDDAYEVYVKAYSTQLLVTLNGNGENTHKLIEELLNIAKQEQTSSPSLYEAILNRFILLIELKLIETTVEKEQLKSVYQKFQLEIEQATRGNLHPKELLTNLIRLANEIQKSLSTQKYTNPDLKRNLSKSENRLFSAKRKNRASDEVDLNLTPSKRQKTSIDEDELKAFCNNLIALSALFIRLDSKLTMRV